MVQFFEPHPNSQLEKRKKDKNIPPKSQSLNAPSMITGGRNKNKKSDRRAMSVDTNTNLTNVATVTSINLNLMTRTTDIDIPAAEQKYGIKLDFIKPIPSKINTENIEQFTRSQTIGWTPTQVSKSRSREHISGKIFKLFSYLIIFDHI